MVIYVTKGTNLKLGMPLAWARHHHFNTVSLLVLKFGSVLNARSQQATRQSWPTESTLNWREIHKNKKEIHKIVLTFAKCLQYITILTFHINLESKIYMFPFHRWSHKNLVYNISKDLKARSIPVLLTCICCAENKDTQ